jgi:excisionase family DNA binding protein
MAAKECTPRQVAEMLQVSLQTVLRCFDSGRLPGYRRPKSQHRRIPHANLLNFLKQHNLPLPAPLASETQDVMAVGRTGDKRGPA